MMRILQDLKTGKIELVDLLLRHLDDEVPVSRHSSGLPTLAGQMQHIRLFKPFRIYSLKGKLPG